MYASHSNIEGRGASVVFLAGTSTYLPEKTANSRTSHANNPKGRGKTRPSPAKRTSRGGGKVGLFN